MGISLPRPEPRHRRAARSSPPHRREKLRLQARLPAAAAVRRHGDHHLHVDRKIGVDVFPGGHGRAQDRALRHGRVQEPRPESFCVLRVWIFRLMILFLCRSVLEFYVEMFSWLLDRDANICVGIEIPRGKFETMSVYVRFLELGLKPHFYCHCCERYGCSRVAVSSVLSFSKTRPRAGSRRRASSSPTRCGPTTRRAQNAAPASS